MTRSQEPQMATIPERPEMRHSLHRAFFFLFAAALPALATNGVIEINQAKALAGGVTAGDTPGFPVTLSANASYILTSDLDLTAEASPPNTHAVVVNAGYVTIDLNGFSIFGNTQCGPPHPVVCANPGTGNGIEVPSGSTVRVHNGTIRNVGNHGVHQESGTGSYESLLVTSCGGDGIHVQNSTVSRVRSWFNGDRGIWAFESAVADSVAYYNKNQGIVGTFARIADNQAGSNGTTGIEGSVCSATGNMAYGNQGVEMVLSGCGWGGNALRSCSGPCATSPAGNLQIAPNDCEGVTCP